MARASSLTDHEISGLPIRAKYRHLRTIWAHAFDNSPTDPISSSFNWWSSKNGVATFFNCWMDLFASSQYFHIFRRMTFHVIGPRWNVCFGFFWIKQFFYTSSWNPGFKQISLVVHSIFACFAFPLSATQINMVNFHEYFPQWIQILFSCHFDVVHVHRQE